MKKLFAFLLVVILMLSASTMAFAHSGRTDSSGGHRDNRNASGLGSYHYHCGGNPAHLHPNGVCRYRTPSQSPRTPAQSTTTPAQTQAPTLTATPVASMVYVNGENISCEAYTIDGSTFFKLRDIAYVLNGTEYQFVVGWNAGRNAIELSRGQPYVAVGGELQRSGGTSQAPTRTASSVLVDGSVVSMTAYTIDGNTYFRLRDIGDVIGFSVSWENNAIRIES